MSDNIDYMMVELPADPDKLVEAYDTGLAGVVADPRYNVRAQALPTFYQAFPRMAQAGKGKVSAPYKIVLTFDQDFGRWEAQTTGDCVSHSTRNAGMLDYCVDAYFGETTYEGRFATENIYGYRGHGGQGASCHRLSTYVSQDGPGGFLVRRSYEDGRNSVDLSNYNSRIGHNWGRSGTPEWLNKIAASNKALRVFRIRTLNEARDAIAAGFGLSRCGWWGYSRTRNKDGVSDVSGRWAHAMAIIGCNDTDWAHSHYDGPLYLVQNSWGEWNSGPKVHEQPDGSFWIRSRYMKAEIENGGVFAIASVRGYNRELVYDISL